MNRSQLLLLLTLALAFVIGGAVYFSQGGGSGLGDSPVPPIGLERDVELPPDEGELPGLSSRAEDRDLAPDLLGEEPSLILPEGLVEVIPGEAGGKRLRGRVVDQLGTPVSGARVRVSADFGSDFVFSSNQRPWVETDEDGQFETEWFVSQKLSVEVLAKSFAKLKESVVFKGEDLGTFELEPGVIVRGVVIDAQGIPVEGAGVFFEERREGIGFLISVNEQEPEEHTAADGSFELGTGLVGPWVIKAKHQMHPAGTIEGESDRAGTHPDLVTIQLPRGSSITGYVEGYRADVDCFVAAVPEDGVQFMNMGSVRTCTVDAAGRFEIYGLAPETGYGLELMEGEGAEGWLGEPLGETVKARSGDTGVVLRMQAARGVRFRVVHQGTGVPIESFTAKAGSWWTEPLEDESGAVITHHDGGRAEFSNLNVTDGDLALLQIFSEGFEPYSLGGIQLPEAGVLDLGDIALKPAPVLAVKVLSEATSLPVQGARVTLSVPEEDVEEWMSSSALGDSSFDARMENRSKRTDAGGLARITVVPGQQVVMTISHRLYAELSLPSQSYGAEEVVVRLLTGGEVQVKVLDAAGAPVGRDVIVDRRFAAGNGPTYLSRETDMRGLATFKNLQAGLHEFRVADERESGSIAYLPMGGEPGAGEEAWVSVEVGEGSKTEIVLQREARGVLSGRVTEGGAPLARASLRLDLWQGEERSPRDGFDSRIFFGVEDDVQSGSDGSFRLKDHKVGEYELVISHPRRVMDDKVRLTLTPGEMELNVDLHVTAIEGVALDQDGDPVEGLEVTIQRADDPSSEGTGVGMIISGGLHGMHLGDSRPTRTDAAGRFMVRGVATGCELTLKLSGGKYQPELVSLDPLRPNEVRSDVRVVVSEGGGIDLHVLMPSGHEPEFGSLSLRKLVEGEPVGELLNYGFEEGRLLIEGIAEGDWEAQLTVFEMTEEVNVEPIRKERKQVVSVRKGEIAEILVQY